MEYGVGFHFFFIIIILILHEEYFESLYLYPNQSRVQRYFQIHSTINMRCFSFHYLNVFQYRTFTRINIKKYLQWVVVFLIKYYNNTKWHDVTIFIPQKQQVEWLFYLVIDIQIIWCMYTGILLGMLKLYFQWIIIILISFYPLHVKVITSYK